MQPAVAKQTPIDKIGATSKTGEQKDEARLFPVSKPRILVVEDEALVARDIRQQLLELGYEPAGETRRAAEAIELCGQQRPDLVLMDVQLVGEMDGIAAAEIIRDRFALPVVFLTAFAGVQIVTRAKLAEPFGYIIKPFNDRELHTVIEMALYKHQAETRQRESHDELAAILRTALDGFWLVDRAGRILEVNDSCCRMHGYTREEMLRMTLADFEVDESPAEITGQIEQLLRDGSGRLERRHRCRDGSVIQLDISTIFRPAFGGRFIAFLRDVTASRQAAAELRAQQHKTNRIFQTAPVGIGTAIGRVITNINDVMCDITGYAREEIIGQGTRFLYAAEVEYEKVGRTVGEMFEAGGRHTVETRWRRKDGTLIDVEISASPLDAGDHSQSLICAVVDMTVRIRMDAALQESNLLLRKAQEVARIGSYKLEMARGRWTSSSQLDEIFGIDDGYARDINGWLDLVAPDQRQEMSEYFSRHVVIEHKRFEKEYGIIRHSDRQPRWVSGIGELEFDASGNPVLMIGTIQDITERKTLESQFQQAQKMEIVGQLAGGVAHDFNNILTAMMLNLELLRGASPAPEIASPLHELEAMVNRAARLTQQLLMFARRQAIQTTTVDVNAALTNLLKMLRRLLGERVKLNFVTDHPSLWIEVDAGMLDQAVMNLCINARDAMPDGGALTLATELVVFDADTAGTVAEARPGGFVCLRFSDTGCGMSAQVMQHVFEPFFTTKEVGKGSGLGLASVHGIVHQHQGWVNVESTEGQGTTFRLYFPCSNKVARTEPGAPVAEPMKGGHETILVVEDEEVVRRLATVMLRRLGYRVLTAADGPEAVRLWEKHGDEVDLLFTDVVMPGAMLGMQLAERLRRSKPALKVVLMSGYSAEILKGEVRPVAGTVFLPKPFESHVLASIIRSCLDGEPAKPGGPAP
jgi:PAS domain S-box-containing protein